MTKLTDKYSYEHEVDLEGDVFLPKINLDSKWGKLTDDQIKAAIDAGQEGFIENKPTAPAPAKPATPSV
jgi:hypothetical protein